MPFSRAAIEKPVNDRVAPGNVRLVASNRIASPKASISTSAAAVPTTVCVDG